MAITKLSHGEIEDGQYVKYDPPRVITEYVGRVLRVYNKEYRAMSDVYTTATFADVWTEENKLRSVLVNANFECDQSQGRAEVDASEMILSIKFLFDLEAEKQREKERAALAERRRLEEEKAEQNRPVIGKKMVVVRGRKVPKGTVGVVAYIHTNGGVLLKDEKSWKDRKAQGQWVNATNLAVCPPG